MLHSGCKVAKAAEAEPSDIPATNVLARAIRRIAQSDGDHNTFIPALRNFSREYSRLFGDPPQRDIKRLRLI